MVNGSLSNQAEPAVCPSPQTSSTIRVIVVGLTTSQEAPSVSESGSCIFPGVNSVSVNKISGCSEVRNSNTIAASGI